MKDFSFDRPPENILRCFARLQSNSDYLEVVTWLNEGMIATALQAANTSDDWHKTIMSGKVQMIERILKWGLEAKDLIEALNKHKFEEFKAGSL